MLVVLLGQPSNSFAQRKKWVDPPRPWKASFGLGWPDLYHLELMRDLSKYNALGLGVGAFFPTETTVYQVSLNHQLLFEHSKQFPELPTWHFDQRLTFYFENNGEYEWNYGFLLLTVGRFCYISERVGFNLEGGFSFLVRESKTYVGSQPISYYEDDGDPSMSWFGARVQIFYRF